MGAAGERRGWSASPAGARHPQEAGRRCSKVPLFPGPLASPSGVEAGPMCHHTPRERAGQRAGENWPAIQANTGVGWWGRCCRAARLTIPRDQQPTQVRAGHHSNGSSTKV